MVCISLQMLTAENKKMKALHQKTVEKHISELENESKYAHYVCLMNRRHGHLFIYLF